MFNRAEVFNAYLEGILMADDGLDLAPPRGMRDFPPDAILLRDKIFNAWTKASTEAGFLKYDAPVVENFDLLARKAGEEVADQIYVFSDKSDRRLALRPEATPSLVRIITGNKHKVLFPAKWWTIAQCFRYERTTKGRKREHYQWNLDIIGEPSIMAEAWILAAAVNALKLLGLGPDDVKIRFNHRKLITALLTEIGIAEASHLDVLLILDKQGKVEVPALVQMLVEKGISKEIAETIFNRLTTLHTDVANGENLSGPQKEISDFLNYGMALGIGDYLCFDPGVVRGLAYYTGIVFEAFDAGRELRAVFGGGRYDNLFSDMTGEARCAVGLGFGDVVLGELLEAKKLAEVKTTIPACVGSFDKSLESDAAVLAKNIISAGVSADVLLSAGGPKKFFQYADRRGARFAVLLAPDEFKSGLALIKELGTGEQTKVPIAEVPAWLAGKAVKP